MVLKVLALLIIDYPLIRRSVSIFLEEVSILFSTFLEGCIILKTWNKTYQTSMSILISNPI